MNKDICPVIAQELKRLRGKPVQLSTSGLLFNPRGILEVFEEDSGRVLVRSPNGYSMPVETLCLSARTILAVGEIKSYAP